MNDQLLEQIKRHEGKVKKGDRHVAYQDHLGYWTIGYGRLVDEKLGGGLTDGEANFLLRNDVTQCYAELAQAYPWIDDLDVARRDVLVNMCFQMGLTRLSKFVQTLAMVRAGDYKGASEEMLRSRWAEQTFNRAKELAIQMETGEYQQDI